MFKKLMIAASAAGVYKTTATAIIKKMEDNEVAALKEIGGRDVVVTGTIRRIMAGMGDEPVVVLAAQDVSDIQV